MELEELYNKLKQAYSNQNLTKIAVTLINLYKGKQFEILRKIVELISETVEISIDPEARYFSKLMMLYHPDRSNFHLLEIERFAAKRDYKGLSSYAHILRLGSIEEIALTLESYEDIDYSPVYEWDINADEFIIITVNEKTQQESSHTISTKSKGISFYDAIKIRMYGHTHTEFPPYYLEDIEEIELAQSGIDDLDGVQYCIHAISIDLSDNSIDDISWLWGLKQLKDINLSDNSITDIDTLSNLKNLRSVNLANNNTISDISPLMNLDKLEYLDLSGVKAPVEQIRELEEIGVTVVV
ncbi:MAG: leucine-rich repeat domain-containing protein [Bacteroidales bacterium]|nr:leucine-rich repeat domain-containing protein [Bacteroidales bacterium]